MRGKCRRATMLIHVGFVASSAALGCSDAHSSDAGSTADDRVGTLRTLIVSYGDHAETFDRLVRDDGQEIPLDFERVDRRPRVGERIAVRGVRDGNRMKVSGYDVLGVHASELRQPLEPASSRRTLRLAVLLLTPEISKEALTRRVFSDPDSPAAFYRENSYGAWTLEGDVYGPYTIATTNCSSSEFYHIAAEAAAAAAPDGFDPEAYDNLLYYIGQRTTGCSYGAAGEIGINEVRGFFNAKYSWYRENSCVAFAQELGHNFGLVHSHACVAPPYTIRTAGTLACQGFLEYGDPYTPMGSACGHFNAPESAALGFLNGCNTLDVTSSGTFEIGPIEAKCSGPQVIRISARATVNYGPQYVYLEYRRGAGTLGTDKRSLQGVYFHASAEYGGNPTGIDSGTRHDTDYALDPFYIYDPLTAVDTSWTEPSSGATFKLVSMGDTATVGVILPDSDGAPATCIDGRRPPSPACSAIVGDAGAPDGGESDVSYDVETDVMVERDAGTDAADTTAIVFDVPTEAPSDGGCSCSAPGRAARASHLLIGLAALIATRRRRSPGKST